MSTQIDVPAARGDQGESPESPESSRDRASLRLLAEIVLLTVVAWLGIELLSSNYQRLLLCNALVNIMLALGLFLTLRSGRLSLAQATLAGVGGYVGAYLATHTLMSLALTIVLGGISAAVVGAILGSLALRLAGFYFVIATLAFAQVFTILVGGWQSVTGGLNGIVGIPRLDNVAIGGATLDFTYAGAYSGYALLLTALGVASYLLVRQMTGPTPIGRKISAVGHDDILASSLGVPITRWRVIAFTTGALIAGVAGAVQASYLGLAAPSTYNLDASVLILAMVFLGGRASLPGVVVGAVMLTYVPEYLRFGEQTQLIYTGVLFVAIAFILPTGLVPTIQAALLRIHGGIRSESKHG